MRPIEADYISTTSRTAGGGPRVRQKDRRGVYQSVDFSTLRSPREQEEYELRKAEDRLRTMDMIVKYRERKIKADFNKLQEEIA